MQRYGVEHKWKKTIRGIRYSFAAFGVLATALIAAGILSACSGSVGAAFAADGGARVSVSLDMPKELSLRIKKLAGRKAESPLFDLAAIRASATSRKGISIIALSSPNPDSVRAEFSVADVSAFAASAKLADGGVLLVSSQADKIEVKLRLERGTAQELIALFPGIDPALLEALSPPAFGESTLTAAEYRETLSALLGKKNLPEIEAAAIDLRLTAPKPLLASSGGKQEGTSLVAKLPLIDLLVLEKPIELSLSWRK